MSKKLFPMILTVVVWLTAAGCSGSKSSAPSRQTEAKAAAVTLTDNMGREVELPSPVETAAVASRYNNELIRACGAIDRVIAVDANTAQDREYWKMFDPADQVIGKGQSELNYERIVELNPQVLILPDNGSVAEAEEKLAPFGIKVFVISGYDTDDFKNQTENIGIMFGVEESASKFYTYFNDKLRYIQSQLQGKPRRSMYLETTTEYSTVVPGNAFYGMGEAAEVFNIFSENIDTVNANAVDPEEVIVRAPDTIIKLITPAQAMQGTGLYHPPEKQQFVDTLKVIQSRPGWDSIPAVRNNDIFMMTQFSHGGASKLVGACYIAKWVYPDLLPDLDPEEVFRAWMEDFQGFDNIEGHFYAARDLP
ncbi:MAG: ABC transporter substrate-binding protein [Spirochaetaceae bacterium]|jgi:iron complex transport system substrate-binding protein|nr:ABC transporter substrate-binding protein [Spirochaetaceae bacterium]